MQPNIELHIDELVFHGFAPHQATNLGEIVQRELTRLLQEQGLPSNLATDVVIGRLNAGSFTIQPTAKQEAIGVNIANSVYKGFTP